MKKIIAIITIIALLAFPVVGFAEQAAQNDIEELPAEESTNGQMGEDAITEEDATQEDPNGQPGEEGAENGDEPDDAGTPKEESAFDDSAVPEEMSVILLEATTGRILFEQNVDQQIYPASTTKLLTALIVLEEAGDLDETITVGDEVNEFSAKSSLMKLKSGHEVTIRELLYGLMLPSGNDAASTLAVHFGGSIDGFADKMNAKAKELGMENSTFVNPHGLNILENKNYSTAEDMAKLAVTAYQSEDLREIMKATEYEVKSTTLNAEKQTIENSNRLINPPDEEKNEEMYETYKDFLYEPATGMKTGLLQNVDGNEYYGCLVASAEKDGLELISCVFADTTDRALSRWSVTIDLFNYGFNNYAWTDIGAYVAPVQLTEQLSGYAENDPDQGQLSIISSTVDEMPEQQLLNRALADQLADGSAQIEQEIEITTALVAPIEQGQEIGMVRYMLNDEEIARTGLVANRTVYATGQEDLTQQNYPEAEQKKDKASLWWLWIVIPAAAVGGFFLVRILMYGGLPRRRSDYDIMTRKPEPPHSSGMGRRPRKTGTPIRKSTYYYEFDDRKTTIKPPRRARPDRDSKNND